MTYAPQTLSDLAALWVASGGVNLGIVGDTSHAATGTSYHLGKSALKPGAYSAVLPRDVAGLSEAASAIDLGRLNGSLTELQAFSRWLVEQCKAHAAGSSDVREIIYSPDGNLPIHRWSEPDQQVYTGPGNGDAGHLTHTHISYYRDSESREKTGLIAPYFGGSMAGLATRNPRRGPEQVRVTGAGHIAVNVSTLALIPLPDGNVKPSGIMVDIDPTTIGGYWFGGPAHLIGEETAAILATDVTPLPDPVPDCGPAIDAEYTRVTSGTTTATTITFPPRS